MLLISSLGFSRSSNREFLDFRNGGSLGLVTSHHRDDESQSSSRHRDRLGLTIMGLSIIGFDQEDYSSLDCIG